MPLKLTLKRMQQRDVRGNVQLLKNQFGSVKVLGQKSPHKVDIDLLLKGSKQPKTIPVTQHDKFKELLVYLRKYKNTARFEKPKLTFQNNKYVPLLDCQGNPVVDPTTVQELASVVTLDFHEYVKIEKPLFVSYKTPLCFQRIKQGTNQIR